MPELHQVATKGIGGIPEPGFETEGKAVVFHGNGQASFRRGYVERKGQSNSILCAVLKAIFQRKNRKLNEIYEEASCNVKILCTSAIGFVKRPAAQLAGLAERGAKGNCYSWP
jgi:hypothetical protein